MKAVRDDDGTLYLFGNSQHPTIEDVLLCHRARINPKVFGKVHTIVEVNPSAKHDDYLIVLNEGASTPTPVAQPQVAYRMQHHIHRGRI